MLRRLFALALLAAVLLAPVADVFAQTTAKGQVVNGRFVAKGSGTAPTLSSCGTATVSGTDTAGLITHSAGAASCVLTFNEAFDTAPACVATKGVQKADSWVTKVTTTTAAMTVTYEATSGATDTVAYVCIGR